MTMTISQGLLAARQLVTKNFRQYDETVRRFGGLIDTYLGEAPRALIVSHILRVNPELEMTPIYNGHKKGFIAATIEQIRNADVLWERAEDSTICMYAWSKDLNRVSYDLYTTYPDLFAQANKDFWRTAYLRQTLGDSAFSILWTNAGITTLDDEAYPKLIYAVNATQQPLLHWTPVVLKRTVFKDCEFVFQLAVRKGQLSTAGHGIEPVPPTRSISYIFQRDDA